MQSLILKAKKLANKLDITSDVTVGHVGCAIRAKSGKIYTGLSVATSANLGFCAEVCAIAQMIKDNDTQIDIAVAVEPSGKIIPPCGRCRELMYQINAENLQAKIMLSETKTITLEKLLPHRWQEYWPQRN